MLSKEKTRPYEEIAKECGLREKQKTEPSCKKLQQEPDYQRTCENHSCGHFDSLNLCCW